MSDKGYENSKRNFDRQNFGKFQNNFDKSKVKCFSCKGKGHYAHECPEKKKRTQNPVLLGMSKGYNTLGSYIVSDLNGNKIQMIIDSGCSRIWCMKN